MTIDAVNNVGPRQQEQKPSLLMSNAVGSAAIVGTTAYAFIKEPINAQKVLELQNDKFEKTFKDIPVETKAEVEKMARIRAIATDEALTARAERKFAKIGAKEGQAVDDMFKLSFIENGKKKALNAITRCLDKLGDATPKVRSWSKAGLYAGCAAILSMTFSLIFDRPSKVA